MLRVKLARVGEEIATRRRLARRFHERLTHVPELVLPPPPDDSPRARYFDVYQNYEIEAEGRDALRAHLAEHGVGTLLQWGGRGVHQFPALQIRQS